MLRLIVMLKSLQCNAHCNAQISHESVIAIMGVRPVSRHSRLYTLHVTLLLVSITLEQTWHDERLGPPPDSREMNLGQTDAALRHLHVHQRYLKPLNVWLLTATEDMKFADFGLTREYIALKQRRHSTKRSFMDDQLHTNSGIGS